MIGLVGLNHKTAPVKVRERFVFDEREAVNFMNSLKGKKGFFEFVVLSTCNRTEVYFNLPKDCESGNYCYILEKWVEFKKAGDGIEEYFYTYSNADAARHLFRVAAGLDSMVFGENQILGQIKEAYRISVRQKSTGAVLNRLFHKAFEAGKRVRTETAISKGVSSVSYAAVELVSERLGGLGSRPVLLIGAGKTGRLFLQSLIERGSKSIYIVNRTQGKADELAKRYKAEAAGFERLREYFLKCDIVVTSTSSPEILIKSRLVKEVMRERKGKPLVFIDLSVPRNVEQEIKKTGNVFLYNIDDLKEVAARNYELKKDAIKKAEKIVDEVRREFLNWMSSFNLTPAIVSLRDNFEFITNKELRNLKKGLSVDECDLLEECGGYLKRKYLDFIIRNLKRISDNGRKLEYIEFVNNLFDITEDRDNAEGKDKDRYQSEQVSVDPGRDGAEPAEESLPRSSC